MSLLYSCFNPFKYQFEIHKILKAKFFYNRIIIKKIFHNFQVFILTNDVEYYINYIISLLDQ